MKLRKSRARRKGRIEIIPMIDVMFFLLATFMLASLSLQNLHSLAVDLPRGQAVPLQANKAITLTVTRDGAILLNETSVTIETMAPVLKGLMQGPDFEDRRERGQGRAQRRGRAGHAEGAGGGRRALPLRGQARVKPPWRESASRTTAGKGFPLSCRSRRRCRYARSRLSSMS